MIISAVLSVIAAIGFIATVRRGPTAVEYLVPISIGLILLWPHWSYRFVLPLTPYLFFYLLAGICATAGPLQAWLRDAPVRAARVALLCVVTLNLIDHLQFVLMRTQSQEVGWAVDAREVNAVLDWMRGHLENEGAVATTNPALVYLRTGRKTVAIDDHLANWESWKRRGVRYLACLKPAAMPNPELGYTVLYRSERQGLWVIGI